MADVQEILGQIDVGIQNYMPTIIELQNQFRQNTGRYMQGLFTHSSPPYRRKYCSAGSPVRQAYGSRHFLGRPPRRHHARSNVEQDSYRYLFFS